VALTVVLHLLQERRRGHRDVHRNRDEQGSRDVRRERILGVNRVLREHRQDHPEKCVSDAWDGVRRGRQDHQRDRRRGHLRIRDVSRVHRFGRDADARRSGGAADHRGAVAVRDMKDAVRSAASQRGAARVRAGRSALAELRRLQELGLLPPARELAERRRRELLEPAEQLRERRLL
jgi:hypothetical protein